jgi:hypothetical protein
MTDTQTQLTALVAIDQRGAISRGRSYPSTARVTIDLAPLDDFARAWLAGRWSSEDGSLRFAPIGEYNSGTLLKVSDPTPEAVLARISVDRDEHDRKAALMATRIERVAMKLRETPENGFYAYYSTYAFDLKAYADSETGTTIDPREWPVDVREFVERVRNETKAKHEDEKRIEREKGAAAAALAEAECAAQDARTVERLDEEERAMHARGYLDLAHVRERLDEEVVEALRAKIEPPGYIIGTSCRRDERKPSTREEWRTLRRIEQLAGITLRRVGCDTYQAELATADGRMITVEITPDE